MNWTNKSGFASLWINIAACSAIATIPGLTQSIECCQGWRTLGTPSYCNLVIYFLSPPTLNSSNPTQTCCEMSEALHLIPPTCRHGFPYSSIPFYLGLSENLLGFRLMGTIIAKREKQENNSQTLLINVVCVPLLYVLLKSCLHYQLRIAAVLISVQP